MGEKIDNWYRHRKSITQIFFYETPKHQAEDVNKTLGEIVSFFRNRVFMMTWIMDACNINWEKFITNVMLYIWTKVPKLQALMQEMYSVLLKALNNLEISETK